MLIRGACIIVILIARVYYYNIKFIYILLYYIYLWCLHLDEPLTVTIDFNVILFLSSSSEP